MNESVGRFYERFPYPAATRLSRQRPGDFERLVLNARLGRPAASCIPEDAEIWVAGCGTRQAVQVALSFPKARVLGTDLSAASLDSTRRLAEAFEVSDRVRLEQRDLTTVDYEGAFHIVFCTGVLHHLEEPSEGAKAIARALKPNGVSLWMVYNEIHRRPFVIFQRGVEALCPDPDDPDARLQTARRLLQDILADNVCIPLRTDLAGYDELAKDDFENFVDALIHPRETSYSPQSLRAFIDDVGLRFVGWRYPALWDPAVFLKDPELRQRAAGLPPRAQEMLIFHVGGYGAPYLDVLVESTGAPAAVQTPLSEQRLLLSEGREWFDIEDGALKTLEQEPAYRIEGDELIVTLAREGYVHPRRWALPADAEPILQALDGTRTVDEVLRQFEDVVDRDELFALLEMLLPRQMGLAAPRVG